MAQPLLTNNSPSAGYIKWTATGMTYDGKGYPVAAGNTNKKYVIWRIKDGITPALEYTDTKPTDMAAGDTILFLNINGRGAVVAGTPLVEYGMVVDGAITAAEVSSNAIQTRHLDSEIVTADKIGAGAITTEKLSVGTLSNNLAANGGFEDLDSMGKIDAWEMHVAPVGGTLDITSNAGAVASGSNSLFFAPSSTTCDIRIRQKLNRAIPVNGMIGTKFYVGVTAGVAGTAITKGFNVRINWYDRLGVALPGDNTYTDVIPDAALTTYFQIYEDQVTPPAGASYMAVEMFLKNPNVTSQVFIDDLTIYQVMVTAHIGNDAITATKIKANAVVAEHLSAGSVGAKQLLISDFTNLIQDPLLEYPLEQAWFRRSGAVGSVSIVNTSGAAGNALRLDGKGTEVSVWGDYFEVDPSEEYFLSVKVQQALTGTSPAGYVRIDWFTKDGAATATQWSWTINAMGWTTVENNVTIPATAYYARLQFIHGNNCTGGNWWISEPRLTRKNNGKLIVDGAIAANHVQAGSITTDKLSVGSIGETLVVNGSFEEFANGMAVGWEATAASNGTISVPTGIASSGKYALQLTATNTSANLRVAQVAANLIPITSQTGRRWYIGVRAGATVATTTGFYVRVQYYDANKVALAGANGVGYQDVRSNGSISTTWSPYEGQILPPATARYMGVQVFLVSPNVATTMYVDEITAREVIVSAVIGDGQVTAAKLVANSISANYLTISDFNNYATGGGFDASTDLTNNWNVGTGISVITTDKKSGTGCLQSTASASARTAILKHKPKVSDGEKIYIHYWFKSTADYNGTSGNGKLRIGDQAGALITAITHGPASTSWVERTTVVTVPSTMTAIEINLSFDHSVGTAWIDELEVRRMNGGELIVDGAIDGQTITGATIQTAKTGARLVMDANSLKGWDANNINYLTADANGLSVTGTVSATGVTYDWVTEGDIPIKATLGNKAARNTWMGYDFQMPGLYFEKSSGPAQKVIDMPRVAAKYSDTIAAESAHTPVNPAVSANIINQSSFIAGPSGASLGAKKYDKRLNEDGNAGETGILNTSSIIAEPDAIVARAQDGTGGNWLLALGASDTDGSTSLSNVLPGVELGLRPSYLDSNQSKASLKMDRVGSGGAQFALTSTSGPDTVSVRSEGNTLNLDAGSININGKTIDQGDIEGFTGTTNAANGVVTKSANWGRDAAQSTAYLVTPNADGTLTILQTGIYNISGNFGWIGAPNGRNFIGIGTNAASGTRNTIGAGEDTGATSVTGMKLNAGDTIWLEAYQLGGSARNFNHRIRIARTAAPLQTSASEWQQGDVTLEGNLTVSGPVKAKVDHWEGTTSNFWIGANQPWDSGPVTTVTDPVRTTNTTMVSPHTISGAIKFNESGWYSVQYFASPTGNPGNGFMALNLVRTSDNSLITKLAQTSNYGSVMYETYQATIPMWFDAGTYIRAGLTYSVAHTHNVTWRIHRHNS